LYFFLWLRINQFVSPESLSMTDSILITNRQLSFLNP
jgi:hypothetical protein